MASLRFGRRIMVAMLAVLGAFAPAAAHGQCSNNATQPYINSNSAFTLADGQGSSYYLAQVCGLAPGISLVLDLTVFDENDNVVLSTQATTDVNGFAHFNITGFSGEDGVTITSPTDPNLFYSNLTCLNCNYASFSGQFIFQFQGTTAQDSLPIQIVGTFLANNVGVITGGEADLNSAGGVFEAVALSGSYTYNATASTGTITLVTPFGTQTFNMALNSLDEGALTTNGGPLIATGRLTRVNLLYISPVLQLINGSYSTEFSGTLPCGSLCGLPGTSPTIAGTGIFCVGCQPVGHDGAPVYSFVTDQIAGGQSSHGTTQSGTSGPVDSFSRAVLVDTSSSSTGTPTRYAAYVASAFEMYLISLDPQGQRPAVSGTATQVHP